MITIKSYQPHWPTEFQTLGQSLRHHLGDLATRIDHIGSTAVPQLAAKDIIDIQVTVAELAFPVEQAIHCAGYERVQRITGDHLPPGMENQPEQFVKWVFKPPMSCRPVNLHVRLAGRANQRYPILFRDYLRAHPLIAQAYAQTKMALAKHHPDDDMAAYYDIKDPVCDIIIGGAEQWAASVDWQAGPSDC